MPLGFELRAQNVLSKPRHGLQVSGRRTRPIGPFLRIARTSVTCPSISPTARANHGPQRCGSQRSARPPSHMSNSFCPRSRRDTRRIRGFARQPANTIALPAVKKRSKRRGLPDHSPCVAALSALLPISSCGGFGTVAENFFFFFFFWKATQKPIGDRCLEPFNRKAGFARGGGRGRGPVTSNGLPSAPAIRSGQPAGVLKPVQKNQRRPCVSGRAHLHRTLRFEHTKGYERTPASRALPDH